MFPDAARVVIDRSPNRYVAFGFGITAASARTWLWSAGNARGPRTLPLAPTRVHVLIVTAVILLDRLCWRKSTNPRATMLNGSPVSDSTHRTEAKKRRPWSSVS